MSRGIFVSYRREDAAHFAGRLFDSISAGLPGLKVFMDVDSIRLGADFVQVLQEQLASCNALILVIGPRWLGQGGKRLDDPSDFVRLEIEAAISRKIPIVPVLVDGAEMPSEDEIPASVRPITRRQYVRIDHENYSAVVRGLVSQLADLVKGQEEIKPDEVRAPSGVLRLSVIAVVVAVATLNVIWSIVSAASTWHIVAAMFFLLVALGMSGWIWVHPRRHPVP